MWVNYLAGEICQLFEPKPDNLIPDEWQGHSVMDTPDESRLLTDMEIQDIMGVFLSEEDKLIARIASRNQDGRTASIKDAEFAQKYKEWEVATMKAEQAIIQHCKDECQQRVERIFREIEKHLGNLNLGLKEYFMRYWRELKKREGI